MFITFTINNKNQNINIMADNNQTIRQVLGILQEKFGFFQQLDKINYAKTFRDKKVVSIDNTFIQAGIYSGDILAVLK